jgi:tRNA U38,U39,U40 pseudouridine synthase TruA
MSTIEEKIQVINISSVARRIKRELEKMINFGICQNDDISISKNVDFNNDFEYHVSIYNNKDKRHYEFILYNHYLFSPPRLILNHKPYSEYLKFNSEVFTRIFYKYKGNRCFCCETKLRGVNWCPQITMLNVMDEVDRFHKDCKEIADIIIVAVIKRKYLINDINIIQWL